MATWLHEIDVYASLTEGEPGPARDWANTRLAIAAPARFRALPDDQRLHDVVLAAAPPTVVDALIAALGRRPVPLGVASAVTALPSYGLTPEDPAALVAAMQAGIAQDGSETDLWLAYGLSILGKADRTALAAAGRYEGKQDWVLPIVLLRVAEGLGAADEAAREVAADLRARTDNPHRLLALLAGMGIPLPTRTLQERDAKAAADYGAGIAHREPFALSLPSGSARRRMQAAVRTLLDGVPGAPAALLRAACERDPLPEWGMLPAALAAWLRAKSPLGVGGAHSHETDPLHDVLFHANGGDPVQVATARRGLTDASTPVLLEAVPRSDATGLILATAQVVRTGDVSLANAIVRAHGGDLEADLRTVAAVCVAAWHAADLIPALLTSADGKSRAIGLVAAEFVPSQEVLEALLVMAVPADPLLRRQYGRCLASMGDVAAVPLLEGLLATEPAAHTDAKALAEAILHTRLGASA